ncbi:1-aminocyclopropane-1-carboxylate synthase-like protein 1 isoform X2 [Lepidochelys kempii]|uniref:1-aminocyclopropane-1-carboxylate synthase-like protein 1 isoform X2 n=1 Tax=Lepidochelys kempii TaxID=8472 RepID=UPI003C6FFF7C
MSSGSAGGDGRAAALSARGSRIASGARGLLDKGFDLYIADPFDRDRNPRGILNLGTSENKLCYDLIQERLTRPDMNYLEPQLLQYSDTQGIESFREEIAKFLTEYAKAPKALNPEHIVVMSGCCAVFATLSTVLCDPGDGYLIPTPYYGGINSKTWLYGGIQPVHVPLFSEVTDEESHPFQLTVEKLEAALQRAKEQGIRVRALILINPHNPLGDIYPAQLLKECLEFAHRYQLHVIIDEIYMLSVYDDTTFTSVLSLDCLPDPERTHFMWGFSKFLKSQTFEAEMELWWKFLDEKLLISPGKAFCCYEPGWFRMVFSDSVDKIYLGIQRLEQMLQTETAEPVANKTSAEEDELSNSEDETSVNHANTSLDEVSEAYSDMKKIVVY